MINLDPDAMVLSLNAITKQLKSAELGLTGVRWSDTFKGTIRIVRTSNEIKPEESTDPDMKALQSNYFLIDFVRLNDKGEVEGGIITGKPIFANNYELQFPLIKAALNKMRARAKEAGTLEDLTKERTSGSDKKYTMHELGQDGVNIAGFHVNEAKFDDHYSIGKAGRANTIWIAWLNNCENPETLVRRQMNRITKEARWIGSNSHDTMSETPVETKKKPVEPKGGLEETENGEPVKTGTDS